MWTLFIAGCFGALIGGMRFLKKTAAFRKEVHYTANDLEHHDLDFQGVSADTERKIAEQRETMATDPVGAKRQIRLSELELEKAKKNYDEKRKAMVKDIAAGGGPNPISIAYWGGAGALVGLVIAVLG